MQGPKGPQWPGGGGYRAGYPQLGDRRAGKSHLVFRFRSVDRTRRAALWQAERAVDQLWRGRFNMSRCSAARQQRGLSRRGQRAITALISMP